MPSSATEVRRRGKSSQLLRLSNPTKVPTDKSYGGEGANGKINGTKLFSKRMTFVISWAFSVLALLCLAGTLDSLDRQMDQGPRGGSPNSPTRDITAPIRHVLYTKKRFIETCCLNNRLQMAVKSIQLPCEIAGRRNATAVLIPPELDDAGEAILRKESSHFRLFDESDIKMLQRVAFEELGGCVLLQSSQIITPQMATMEEVTYGRLDFDDKGPVYTWLYDRLKLPETLEPLWKRCYGGTGNDLVAVHMRIESDWEHHCTWKEEQLGVVGQVCYTPKQIAEAIEPFRGQPLLLIYGSKLQEKFLEPGNGPFEVISKEYPDQEISHPLGNPQCNERLSRLSYNQQALLDFWSGLNAKSFVGTHYSTWSNALTHARCLRGKCDSNYLYSCEPTNQLFKRTDTGLQSGKICESAIFWR